MEGQVQAITFKQFFESVYFKAIARTCMVVLVPAMISLGGFIWTLIGDVSKVQDTQAERAKVSDANFANIDTTLIDVTASIGQVDSNQRAMQRQLDNIEGILEGMNRPRVGQLVP